jgi:hypothetical protein
MTGKPPGEPLAPRTTDQNTHSGAKALINSSKSEAHLSAEMRALTETERNHGA